MEVADAEDIPDGMSLPDELSRREDRLAWIEARAAQKHARSPPSIPARTIYRKQRFFAEIIRAGQARWSKQLAA